MNTQTNPDINSATLLIHCPDQKGIVSTVSEFLYKNNGNVLYLDQHVDHQNKVFFMRAQWDLDAFLIPKEKIGDYFKTLIADRFNMTWELHFTSKIPRMAVFVSNLPHCLYDILSRQRSGEWLVEIPVIISNHEKLKYVADEFGIEFHCLPIDKQNKLKQEETTVKLLEKYKIDLIVLARYMQVLSDFIINKYNQKIINIHHSFLPAFPGAKPYDMAYQRGVKLI